MTEDLAAQVERERQEIENAPKVPVRQYQSGVHGRCSFCGRLAVDMVLVDTVHGQERYKGECCGGHPNRE